MSVEKLERVLWRIRKNNPKQDIVKWIELKRAIMYEIGTSMRAYNSNRRALVDLGWIKVGVGTSDVTLTNEDL